MAHFAKVDENDIVVDVIFAEQDFIDYLVAQDKAAAEKAAAEAAAARAAAGEEEPVIDEDAVIEEPHYTKQWIQTSYNTINGKHTRGGTPLRANYATVGCIYDRKNDVFYPPVPTDLPGAVISGPPEWKWTFPIPKPKDGRDYVWDLKKSNWILRSEKVIPRLIITPDDDSYGVNDHTFLVYDLEIRQIVHTCPKQPELNSDEVAGQGRPTFRPFGITNDESFIYIASNNKLGKFDKATYKFRGLVDVPLFVNTHEIVIHNNIIYAANTSNDTIGIYDIANKVNKFFNVNTFEVTTDIAPPQDVESHDTAHVNSLCIDNGRLYFCLHNLDRRDSQLGYFDINTFKAQIVAEAGRCAHGVKVLNNKLYSLSTGTGELIEVDLDNKSVELYKVVDSNKTFLRGLDIVDDCVVFGGSNTYSEDRTIYMNNCFAARFYPPTKEHRMYVYFRDTNIISDMKLLS